jgi:hypothetical protein
MRKHCTKDEIPNSKILRKAMMSFEFEEDVSIFGAENKKSRKMYPKSVTNK